VNRLLLGLLYGPARPRPVRGERRKYLAAGRMVRASEVNSNRLRAMLAHVRAASGRR
jgi:hypothetical protein